MSIYDCTASAMSTLGDRKQVVPYEPSLIVINLKIKKLLPRPLTECSCWLESEKLPIGCQPNPHVRAMLGTEFHD
jgi:hypothetical protein